MAKIVVYSMAYRGDVFPYVPVATGLARAGHDVVFVVPEEFHPLFASEPFRCAPSGTDYGPTMLDQHADYVARWGKRLGGGLMLRLYFGELTIPYLAQLHEALEAEVADADLLFSHPAAAVTGSMAAELHDVPMVVGDLFPMIMLSEYDPISSLPYLGRRGNRVVIRAAKSRMIDPLLSARGFRSFREQLGLPTRDWNVLDARLSTVANLGLVPSAYYPPRPDWPENYTMVGFTPWDGPEGGRLEDDVTEYLDAGDPPVVVTLGTSAASARPKVFDQALAALDAHHERAVILASNDELAAQLTQRSHARHLVRPFIPLAPCSAGPKPSSTPAPTAPTAWLSSPACRRSSFPASMTRSPTAVANRSSARGFGSASPATSTPPSSRSWNRPTATPAERGRSPTSSPWRTAPPAR